jgi:hypothetical protein
MIGPRFEEELDVCVSAPAVLSLALDEGDVEWSWAVEATVSEVEARERAAMLVVLMSEEVVVGKTPIVVMGVGVPNIPSGFWAGHRVKG